MTKTPAKTTAPSTATTDGTDDAAPKARAKTATKVSSPADGSIAANTPLKKPSAKADQEPMNAAKSSPDTKLASAWKTKAGKDLTDP